MRDFLDTFRRLLAGIFGSNIPTEADWRNIPEELLTPREHLMWRSSRVMLVGVVMNLIASVLVFGLAIVAGTQNSALFTSIRELLLTNYLVSDDTAVLLVGAGLLGNMAILLVLAVVIIAQEFWTVIVAIVLLVVNGVALFALGFTL